MLQREFEDHAHYLSFCQAPVSRQSDLKRFLSGHVSRYPHLRLPRIVCARLLALVATTVVLLMPGSLAGGAPSAKDRIVFVSTRAGGSWQVFIMNLDGSHPKRLTTPIQHRPYPPAEYTTPDLSPDGRRITFGADIPVAYGKSDRAIFLMNADGSHLRRLTDLQAEDPSFSSDGRRIVFVVLDRGQLIHTMNVDGSSLVNTGQVGYSPAWSPDGQRIAFTCQAINRVPQICLMNNDGSHLMRLTNIWSLAPQFSPDGHMIVFMALHGSMGPWFDISLMAVDGSNVHRLTPPDWVGESPSFTPDGRVVFVSHAQEYTGNPPYPNRQIYVINVDGTNLRRLTAPPGENGFAPFAYLY